MKIRKPNIVFMNSGFKIFVIVLLTLSLTTKASDYSDALRRDAKKLAKSLEKGDYETFIDYMYPAVVEKMGGKSKLAASMKEMFLKQGIVFKEINMGDPEKVVEAGDQLHCFISQDSKASIKGLDVILHGHLMAISGDKGKTWTFIDAGAVNSSNVLEYFPRYNFDLPFPPKATVEKILRELSPKEEQSIKEAAIQFDDNVGTIPEGKGSVYFVVGCKDSSIMQGEKFTLSYSFVRKDANNISGKSPGQNEISKIVPVLPEGMKLIYPNPGVSSTINFEDGSRNEVQSANFTVVADRKGEYVIPPTVFDFNGERYSTTELRLIVK